MANEFKIKNGLVVSGSADIEQDLTVRGTITADQLNISIVSSSVMYESGSTKFGDSIDDNHAFTGSVSITGSINLNGQAIGTGKLDETTFNSFTSSYNTVSGSINTRVGDLESFSSSLDGNFVTEGEFGTHTSSMNSFTSSTLTTIGALNNESSSIRGDFNSFTSSYTNVSTSIDSRLDTLETLSGSFTGSFSGSFNGDGTNLYNIPASGVTGLNLTQIADGFATASISSISGLTVNANTAISGNLIVSGNVTFGDTLFGTPEDAIFTASIKTHNTTYLGDMNTSTGDALIVSGAVKISGSQIISNDLIVSGNVYFGDTLFGTPEDVIFTSSIKTHNTTYLGDMNTSTGDALIVSGAVKISGSQTISNDLIVSGNVYFGDTLFGTPEDVIFTSSIKTHNTTYLGDMNTSMGDALIVSGSVKINGHLSGSSLTGAIDYSNLTNVPTLVSGSSQIDITSVTNYTTFSSSIATTTNDLDGRLDSIETTTSSLNSFTSSIDTTIKSKLNTEGVISGSIQVNLPDVTGYSTFSSSVSSSIGLLSSSVATTDDTQNGRLSSLETESGSIRSDLNSYTSSNDSTNTTQNGRLTSLEGKSGSYATTGSNVFVGSQTISGSVIIRENLTVLGSSSITYTTSSQLRVDDNVITVNTSNPAERFGGLQVYDSGSVSEATGSLLWDSQKNRWVYQQSSESTYGGGVLMSGPRSSGSLGDELTLTSGKIARSAGGDHLNDSIITEYGGVTIGISGSLEITGSIFSTTTPLVSGSGQISFNGITDKPTLVSGSSQVSFTGITDKPTLVSGSAQIDLTETTNYSSGIKTRLNAEGVISGSSQISFGMISAIPSGLVSGSSQILYSGLSMVPSGIVSGSSQVLGGTGIWSGSAQLPAGTVSGSSQVSFNNIADKPTLVSGSSQIIYGSLTGIPSGIVSGSSQIGFLGLSGIPTGLVSGSSQVLGGSGVWSGSAQLPGGVISGSSQVSFNSISGIPSGLVSGSSQVLSGTGIVSGSSQITISSTSGFGSYINQAVLTSSSPSFSTVNASTVNATTFSGTLSGNASTATFATNSSKLYSTDSSYSYTSGAPYYGYLTYDGTYWQFKVSPASPDQVRVYTADRLSGNAANQTGGANTIVQRDSNGYIQNSYFYSSGGGAERNASGMGYFAGHNSSDYYYRSYTAAAAAALLSGQSMNINGTATNITAYTINQSVGTGNSPTFASINIIGNSTLGDGNGDSTRINDILYLGASDSGDSHFYFGEDSSGWYGSYWYWDSSYTHYWYSRHAGGNTVLMYHDTRETTNVYFQRNILPNSNNAYNLGSASLGWANIYTNDLHLSNMNKPEGNDIDGTNGTWTIQEGEENLYIINNRNNKKFKITLEEIL